MATTTPSVPHTDYQVRKEQGGRSGPSVSEHLDKSRDEEADGKKSEQAPGMIQSVKDAALSVAETAQDAYETTTETISGFNDDVMAIINRHPKQAVLIGFAAGVLVGAFLCGGAFASSRRS